MPILIILMMLSLIANGREICLSVEGRNLKDPFVKQYVLDKINQYILESGWSVGCSEKALRLYLRVDYNERPLVISAGQRVKSYLFSLKIRINGRRFSASVPYSLPYGGLGELPRRKAVEEAMGRMKLSIIEYLLQLGKNEGSRRTENSNK